MKPLSLICPWNKDSCIFAHESVRGCIVKFPPKEIIIASPFGMKEPSVKRSNPLEEVWG